MESPWQGCGCLMHWSKILEWWSKILEWQATYFYSTYILCGTFLWVHIGMYTVKSGIRRDVHSSAVPSSPCEIYNHSRFAEFGGLQKKANLLAQRLSLINFTNVNSILQVWYPFHHHLLPVLSNTGITFGTLVQNHDEIS